MSTEEKMLLKGRAGKEMALQIEGNTSGEANKVKEFFQVKKTGRASEGLLEALNDTVFVTTLKDMIGAASSALPPELVDKPNKVLVSVICQSGSAVLVYLDKSTGLYKTGSLPAGFESAMACADI